MPIDPRKFVDNTSRVGGVSPLQEKDLILRMYTDNPRMPVKAAATYQNADEVKAQFGDTSEEYERADTYFDYVSKLYRSPSLLSIAGWATADTDAKIFGDLPVSLADLQLITNGDFTITLGGVAGVVTVDFSGANTFLDVAAILQTQIQALGGLFATNTVTYNAFNGAAFLYNSVVTGDYTLTLSAGINDILIDIGWNNPNTIVSGGSLEQTVDEVLESSLENGGDNFATFLFLPVLTNDQIVEASDWNDARNIEFIYHAAIEYADASTVAALVTNNSGTALTIKYDSLGDEPQYHEVLPCSVGASINYDKPNSLEGFMFQLYDGFDPSVTDTAISTTLDKIRVNYYGQTQVNGVPLSFYQRGVLQGGSDAPLDMLTYFNEVWLKSKIKKEVFNIFILKDLIPASLDGAKIIEDVIIGVVDLAKSNGSITLDKTLKDEQKNAITMITNDDSAWQQVQNNGYWLSVTIGEDTSIPVQYFVHYVLVYSKTNQIRKVTGDHTLI